MTAQEYLGVLRRGWITILAAALVGIALAALALALTPAKYSATVTFYISTRSDNTSTDAYQGSLLSQDRVKSYTQLLSSYRLGDDIVRRLGLADDPADVAGELSGSIAPETVLLTAEVTDRSPQRAQAIAGAMSLEFPTLVAALEKPADSSQQPAVTAQVVQGPLLSAGPVSPRAGTYLVLGAIAGLLVGICVVVLRRTFDRRVTSAETLERAFPEPLLGSLVLDKAVETAPLFLHDRPRAPISENLRTVRTTFELFNFDGGRCHLVTSAVAGEGKSTLLVNLALAEADAGRRVLVVEADLRRPQASTFLGLPRDVGLTQVLGERVSLAAATQQGPSPRVWCLASGPLPPNPYEMIQSSRMAAVLREAREHYDTVLVDGPPLLPVADALELAREVDSVVVVVRARFAPAASVARAHAMLAEAGPRHVGVVFNGVPRADTGDYSSYYSYDADAPEPPDSSGRSGFAVLTTRRRVRPAPPSSESVADPETEVVDPETEVFPVEAPEIVESEVEDPEVVEGPEVVAPQAAESEIEEPELEEPEVEERELAASSTRSPNGYAAPTDSDGGRT